MNANLHPMSLGEILDRTFQIYRAKFPAFIAIAAVPLLAKIATGVLGLLAAQSTLSHSSKVALGQIVSWLPVDWLPLFVSCLIWPVLVHLASCSLQNEEVVLGSSVRSCDSRRWSWLALAGILWMVWHLLPHIPDHFVSAIGARTSYRPFGLFDVLVDPILRYFLLLSLAFGVPAWMLEGLPTLPALLRGAHFIRKSWLRVFMAWLMSGAVEGTLFFVLWAGITLSLRLVPANLSNSWRFYEFRNQAFGYATWTSSVLTASIIPIALTLIYYDQRIRKEGYDIERMMDAAGLNAPATLPSTEGPAPPAEPEEAQA